MYLKQIKRAVFQPRIQLKDKNVVNMPGVPSRYIQRKQKEAKDKQSGTAINSD